MPKYISSSKISLEIEWSDTDNDDYSETEILNNINFGCEKEIDWLLESIEHDRNEQ